MKPVQFILLAAAALLLAAPAPTSAELKPDQIALVVNRNEPNSRELAVFYAQARGIPDGRIIELDLPTVEEMPFDRYEREVTPHVRRFLRERLLQEQVKCLVTFYGVPLRISERVNGIRENQEIAALRKNEQLVLARLQVMAEEMEKRAAELNPSFKPQPAPGTLEGSARRIALAGAVMQAAGGRLTDPRQQKQLNDFALEIARRLTGPLDPDGSPAAASPDAPPPEPIADLVEQSFDPEARERLRVQVRQTRGLIDYARILKNHLEYLSTEATGSAFDNELALLWWPSYSRSRWQPNMLNPRFNAQTPPVMMVMRLDAPTPQMVRDLIANTLATEREGLEGRLVIDSRGIAPKDQSGKDDAFGLFDEHLRRLATIVQTHTDVPVKLDEHPNVIAANSEKDVALYAGWYSVRNYVPGMRFNRGAVGFHIASFELLSLRNEHEPGWVRGLLYGGVVGTLGPVAEPYLHSFPFPDEFFPLLLTGKLTLAEVYWTTTPLTSWMQSCIGDPLYNPYAKSPKLAVEHLPEPLRRAIRDN